MVYTGMPLPPSPTYLAALTAETSPVFAARFTKMHENALVAKREQAKAQIAARRALKRKVEADKRAAAMLAQQRVREAAVASRIPEFYTAFGQTFRTGPAPTSWRDEPDFLQALATLGNLYGVAISGCGCCGSPYLITIDPGQKLIGYTNKDQLKPMFAPKAVEPFVAPGEDSDAHGIGLRSSGREY